MNVLATINTIYRLFNKLLVLVFFLLLVGCPYESKVPVAEPSEKVDKGLLGKWVEEESGTKLQNQENPDFYQINKYDKLRYEIIENEYKSTDSVYEQKTFISHITTVEDITFLNMKQDGSFYLHRIDHDKDYFTLFEVTDNIDETFEDSKALYEYVNTYKGLSFFYNKEEKSYKKVK
jgi:hypothetical protein